MARVTRAEWYRRVNEAWPAEVPALTAEEAVRAARRLYRFVRRRTWTGDVRTTSGNRSAFSMARGRKVGPNLWRSAMVVNPSAGWKDLVHIMSHVLAPALKHGGEHARLELRMIREVRRRGWLAGKLRTEPEEPAAPEDTRGAERAAKLERMRERLARWETKRKRAETAVAKLARQIRAAERRAAAPPAPPKVRAPRAEPEGVRMGPAEAEVVSLALEHMEEWEERGERALPTVTRLAPSHYRLHLTDDAEVTAELRWRVAGFAGTLDPREARATDSLLRKLPKRAEVPA